MPTLRLLLIDDEPHIRRVVRTTLEGPDVQVLEAATATEGAHMAATAHPDLIILDLGLPDRPGLLLCQELRRSLAIPILVLSARHSDAEKADLLDAGADDYVTKPFSTVELQARVRALLRRATRPHDGNGGPPGVREAATDIRAEALLMDLAARRLVVRDREVHLTPTEWELLKALAARAGRTLTHRQLFDEVWRGRTAGDAQQYLRVYITHLRRKIEVDPVRPRYIVTEPGVGYRFVAGPTDDTGGDA
jgi:two-component system, OmpR family, KDP operon response regulator KdpE